MDFPEIAPQQVSSIEELFAKLDMIHEAAKQWESSTGDDDDLGALLLHRSTELFTDLNLIDFTPEHWQTVGEKIEGIAQCVKQRNINDLNASYAMES